MSLITSRDEFAEKLVKLALEKMTDSDLLGLRFALDKYTDSMIDALSNFGEEMPSEFYTLVLIFALTAREVARRELI